MNAMLRSTDRPISQTYRLALLDLDGVVYRGKNPVEHAADSIRAAQRAGMQVEYTTNNSSRFQRVVAEQLRGFGLDVEPRQVITSSVVAAAWWPGTFRPERASSCWVPSICARKWPVRDSPW